MEKARRATEAVYNVAAVPIYGMRRKTEPNVPTMLPRVERAETAPAVPPAEETEVERKRTANGDTNPSNSRGAEKSTITPISDP
jgi:hypothetical protein